MELIAKSFYLLRWVFEFHTGGRSVGLWSSPGDIEKNGAWRQTRPGLTVVRALVEGKHFTRRETVVLAEASGAEFVMFAWRAVASLGNPIGLKGSMTPRSVLAGLEIVTREQIILVTTSGEVLHQVRPDSHKQISFATYGR